MIISLITELYRLLDRPTIERGSFSATVDANKEINILVEKIWEINSSLFEDILIDDSEVSSPKDQNKVGSKLEFKIKIPTGGPEKFYHSILDLISGAPQISRGKLPQEFYLLEENYLHGNDIEIESISKLSTVCEIINKLSNLAHYHVEKPGAGHYKLIFMQQEESVSKANVLELETIVDGSMLDLPSLDLGIFNSFKEENLTSDPHYISRVGVFRVSLVEFLKKSRTSPPPFLNLLINWDDFVNLYNKNLETYLSGFAFHKAKREIAEAEFNIAEQFSKITSEITGKLLGIPVSLAAAIAIIRTENILESFLIVSGLSLATLIISGTVGNQQRQLERISHAKDVIFNSFEGRQDSYPEDLKNKISEMKLGLEDNEKKLKRLLWIFRVLSWSPFLLGVLLFVTFYA